MYYTQEQIDRANQADLVSFLQSQGEQLTRAGNEYRWKRHDSLTVRGNKWYRHSQSKGGGPVDFVMEFFGKSFTEAVELLTGEKGAAPPPDRQSPASFSDFRLPPHSPDNSTARNYLTACLLYTSCFLWHIAALLPVVPRCMGRSDGKRSAPLQSQTPCSPFRGLRRSGGTGQMCIRDRGLTVSPKPSSAVW